MKPEVEKRCHPIIATRRFITTEIIPRICYRIKTDKEAKKEIKNVKKMLKRNPDLSYVIIQNHQIATDPVFGGRLAKRIDPQVTRPVFAPVSYVHTNESAAKSTNKNERLLAKMNDWIRKCGVEAIPVIQTYQRENPAYNFSPQEVFASDRSFVRRLGEIKRSGKAHGCIIMPEGHRSENGVLGKGESGINHIVESLRPVVVVPLGIHSPDRLKLNGINFGKKIRLNLGEITVINPGEKSLSTDQYMTNIAMALPPQMRGQYGNQPL